MKFKEFVKSVKKPDWISDIYVKDKDGDIHDLLDGFCGVYKLNPSIKRKLNDAEVIDIVRKGPYCNTRAYAYHVTLDFVVQSVKEEHRVVVTFQNGSIMYSDNC